MRNLLLLFCLLFLDCGYPRPYRYTRAPSSNARTHLITVCVAADFSSANKLAIDNALLQWNYALNGWIELREARASCQGEMDKLFIALVSPDAPFIPKGSNGLAALAWVDQIAGRKIFIVSNRDESPAAFEEIVLHELGHALGGRHIEGKHSLMGEFFDLDDYRCIDRWTSEEIALAWNVPAESLNYCQK